MKGYKCMSKEKSFSALSELELVESAILSSKNSFDDKRLKKIREDLNELRDIFSTLK